MLQPRAALYCRLSKEDAEKQQESESIQNQKALLLDYAAQQGWQVCAVFSDEDYSGADRRRPGFNAMLHAAEAGRFEILLCKTQSRFARDLELVERYIHGLFPLWGIRFVAVVDNEDRLVGIITMDDVVDILEEETTEDIEKMAAVMPSDKPYLRMSVFEAFKKRIPWLLLLMISATFTGSIITSFESALSRYVVLTAFIPMLMDTGGNAGGQASAIIIRGLSLDEIAFKDWGRVVWKEMRTAALCGLTLAACNFVKLLAFDRVGVSVAGVVCFTLLMAVIVAKIVGSTLPILAKKIGMDPAVMASPFITTIVDAISLLIYFRVATVVLGI